MQPHNGSQGPRWIQKSRDVGLQPFLDSQADSAMSAEPSAMSLPQPAPSPAQPAASDAPFFTVPKVLTDSIALWQQPCEHAAHVQSCARIGLEISKARSLPACRPLSWLAWLVLSDIEGQQLCVLTELAKFQHQLQPSSSSCQSACAPMHRHAPQCGQALHPVQEADKLLCRQISVISCQHMVATHLRTTMQATSPACQAQVPSAA